VPPCLDEIAGARERDQEQSAAMDSTRPRSPLDHGHEAIGRAGGVGNNLVELGVEATVVHANHEGRPAATVDRPAPVIAMSFTATTSKSRPRCRAIRQNARPVRPKPLIPTRVVMVPPGIRPSPTLTLPCGEPERRRRTSDGSVPWSRADGHARGRPRVGVRHRRGSGAGRRRSRSAGEARPPRDR
jgi:hypothetical protein